MRLLLVCIREDATRRAATARMADALIDRGHTVVVASDVLPLATRATQVHTSPSTPLAVMTLARAMRRHRVHVVQSASPAANALIRLAARITRVAISPPVEPLATVEWLEHQYRSAYVRASRLEIPILCYHRLVQQDAEGGAADIHLRADKFEAQLRYLRDHGYRTMHFGELSNRDVFDHRDRRVILTFDDGYEDNYRLLFPLLRKYQAKAVIYLVSGLDSNAWDRDRGEPTLRLLTAAERREMLDGGLVEFGAHTVTHADLSTVSAGTAAEEIRGSKCQLERELGCAVETLSYPYGRPSPAARDAARAAGFRYALVTNSGPSAIHDDPLHVRRIVVFPSITLARFARKVSGRYLQRASKDAAAMPVLTPRYVEAVARPAV